MGTPWRGFSFSGHYLPPPTGKATRATTRAVVSRLPSTRARSRNWKEWSMRFVLARPKPDDASRHTPTVLKTNAQRKAASRIRCTPVVFSHRAGNPPSPTLAILPRSSTRFYAHPRINQRRTRFQLLPPHPASESTVPISPPLQERTLTPATARTACHTPPPKQHRH